MFCRAKQVAAIESWDGSGLHDVIVKFIRVTRRLHRRLTMAIFGRTLLIGEGHIFIVNKRISLQLYLAMTVDSGEILENL